MVTNKVQAVVLAAGKSTRFNTGKTKLVEKICGQEMILYSTRLLEQLHIPTTVVVGYQQELIKDILNKYHGTSLTYCVQEQQKGTGHALMCTQNIWDREHILIMNGDVPLVTPDIIQHLYEEHLTTNADISFVTSHNPDPTNGGYGRVIKRATGTAVIEARDFEGDATQESCINAGIYLIRRKFLEETITRIEQNQKSHEFYLTDLIKIASDHKRIVTTTLAPFDHIRGINNFQELWAAEQVKRSELIKYWMDRGVHFSVAHNVHIDLNVSIGAGSFIGCGVHLLGKTCIGKNCRINEFSSLENATIGDETLIHSHTIIKGSTIGVQSQIGPFAHLETCTVAEQSIIGNFVEIKRSNIGKGTKAKHLTYIGDTQTGHDVNIGAGSIVCNYDGNQKQKTIIEDETFIGSNNTIVAPVRIGRGAFTAAGSVITDDVPPYALAIARAHQKNKEGYATKLRTADENENASTSASFIGALKTKNSAQTT